MDSKGLVGFVKLYEKRSIRKAAADLYITPQGLSKILQSLEGELDAILFERTPQGLEPTEAGEYFYEQAVLLLKHYDQMKQNLETISGQKKELTFVCSYGVMSALPYERFMRFQKEHPEYHIRWQEYPDRHAARLLTENRFDFALLVMEEGAEDLNTIHLFDRKPVLLVYEGHPLYHAKSIQYEDLKNESLIMEGKDFWINQAFRQKCIDAGFYPNIDIEPRDISFCHNLCGMKQGLGITIDFVENFIQTPGVRAIPFADETFIWPVYLVYQKNKVLNSAGKEWKQFLEKEYGEKKK